ncbi:MAG TPA: retropepsin-like aspartic protease [Pyrinomonadaceae bacterium]|nr:retropepsin-like aspartic protease [Pyrinomonadaceae bacterium]
MRSGVGIKPRARARTFLLAATLVLLSASHTPAASYAELRALYSSKQFFELRDEVERRRADDSAEMLFYRGVVANKFNRPDESIGLVRKFLKEAPRDTEDSLLKDAHEILLDDYVKTYRYREASEVSRVLLGRFRRQLDARQLEDVENAFKLWAAVADVPRQSVRLNGGSRLRTHRDKAGLVNLPVEVGGRRVSFVFDTGANISTVTASFARQLGFRLIEADIRVGTITGHKVRARLGVAPEIKVGRASVRHAVFLVFEDKDLFFPPINYQINGIVGFPVMEALRQITLTRDGDFVIPPRPAASAARNMALDELTPLIAGEYKGRRLTFSFDTGAAASTFYPPFFKAFEQEVRANSAQRRERIGGAGGFKEVTAYRVKSLVLTFAGRRAEFASARVMSDSIRDDDKYFYGNLGQDLIKQFPSMTLNFDAMSITFE